MYFCYKTTNTLNDKYYYGVHKGEINDTYYGSGVGIKRAIEKYGKEVFQREVVKVFSSEKEMYEYEKQLVTEDVVNDVMSYNATLGGVGGFSHIDISGDNNSMKSEETRKKVSEALKISCANRKEEVRRNQKIATEAARVRNTGRKRPTHSAKIRENAMKQPPKFVGVSPEGYSYLISSLPHFCRERGFIYSSIYGAADRKQTIYSGEACGWYFCRV